MGTTQAEAQRWLTATFSLIKDELADGNQVNVFGFGIFETASYAERPGLNPRTGEKVTVPASVRAKFRAAKALKDVLNA